MNTANEKKTLRQSLRHKRRSLSGRQQQHASERIVSVLNTQRSFTPPKRVALYLAQDGELDLHAYIEHCWQYDVQVYLPLLHTDTKQLRFARYQAECALTPNRFGIPEPLQGDSIEPALLDWVLFPLVGFDLEGGRLGMGGGFYDRTFADADQWPQKPRMIGVAHECQKLPHIPLESWDIKLDAIASDAGLYNSEEE